MNTYAVLVDGGFIKHKLGTSREPFTAQIFSQFLGGLAAHPALQGLSLHRVYFYDAHPLEQREDKPLRGGRVDFSQHTAARRNRRLHMELSRLPFVALRMGELAFRGWSLQTRLLQQNQDAESILIRQEDLRPDIAQKGVDMRIGLDIAALTLKTQVKVIVLVTGDSDFIPAMKFARREGAQLFLAALGHAIKDSMREHADLVLDVS